MSIRITGRYIPVGKIRMRKAIVAAPEFLTQPSIQHADNYVGTVFTAVPGTFTPPNATVSYRWLLGGVQVSTATTYTPVAAGSLVLEVTLTTSGGTVKVTTAALVIIFRPPVFTVQPSISPNGGTMGTTFIGQDGTYSNATTVVRQWLLNGQPINNQTTNNYVSDGTGSLTYRITLTGQGGTVSATSPAVTVTASVTPQHAPRFTVAPGLLGTFAEGSSVSIPIPAADDENNIQTFAITSGQLPGGLVIDMFSGVISGTLAEVTQDMSYDFEVTVTDRTNLSVKGTFTIKVANVKTTVTWQTDNSQSLAMPAPGQPVNVSMGATSS